MNHPIDIINTTTILLSLPIGGAAVWLLAEVVKRLFGMNSGKVIHAMVVLISGLMSLAAYKMQYNYLPLEVLGLSGPAIYGISQFLYKLETYATEYAPSILMVLNKVAGLLSSKPATATTAVDAAVAAVSVPADAATPEAAPESTQQSTEFSL